MQGFLESGRKEGAEVVTGGERRRQPRLLRRSRPCWPNTNRDMRVVREEIFGPVVCVQSFDDDDLDSDREVRQRHRIRPRREHLDPATSSIAHTLARKIKAGTVWINTHNYGDAACPFGGYKQSGWGREMGKEVMEHYTETKAVGVRLV